MPAPVRLANPTSIAAQNKAYIGNQIWDISSLSECVNGQSCSVSSTFTDPQFHVPMGCAQVTVDVSKMRGPGQVTTTAPGPGNGFRGTVHVEDLEGGAGAHVYDLRVTLNCVGGERSAPQVPVRLSCAHNMGTQSCHMGRIEVFQPTAMHVGSNVRGTWGTVW